MMRYTQLRDRDEYTAEALAPRADGAGYSGEAVTALARYENLHAHLLERSRVIPEELERLRQAGKEKTVTFRELLGEKLMNDRMLYQLKAFGLEETHD